MQIERGELLLVNLEPVRGNEQGKIRPAVVIQNDVLNKFSPLTIIAPITSKSYSKEYPTNVFVKRGDSVLKESSTILLNQLRTIDKKRIIKKIGYLDRLLMKKVDLAIKICLDLNY